MVSDRETSGPPREAASTRAGSASGSARRDSSLVMVLHMSYSQTVQSTRLTRLVLVLPPLEGTLYVQPDRGAKDARDRRLYLLMRLGMVSRVLIQLVDALHDQLTPWPFCQVAHLGLRRPCVLDQTDKLRVFFRRYPLLRLSPPCCRRLPIRSWRARSLRM